MKSKQQGVLDKAVEGQGRNLVIMGSTGMGKSFVLLRIVEALRENGLNVDLTCATVHMLACALVVVAMEEPTGQEECSRFVYEYRLMEKLLKLEMEMASMKERVDQAEKHSSASNLVVAVHVGLSKDTSVANGEKIKFDRIILDTGRYYNVTEGVFLAPVSGTYLLSANICVDNKLWATVQIIYNGIKVGFFFTGDSVWESCGSAVATVVMRGGDKAWLVKAGGNTANLHEAYGWNTFTVNLIAAM